MNLSETARILAMVAGIDHRVPPVVEADERVAIWQQVLAPLDYATTEQGVLELARDPGLVAIRPGDVYQATKRVMRRNLAKADLLAIDPPDRIGDDPIDTPTLLAWKRALVRAVGRGTPPQAAQVEADQAIGVTRLQLTPTARRDVAGLIEATIKEISA